MIIIIVFYPRYLCSRGSLKIRNIIIIIIIIRSHRMHNIDVASPLR